MAEWQVNLLVSGPITIYREIKFRAEKGVVDPFWTDIRVKNVSHGVSVYLIARADNQAEANEAALYFVGQALDYLCLKINLPLYLSLTGTQIRPIDDNVRRIVTLNEWVDCFRIGREIGAHRATFSRALSWYRKGRNSEDPIDAFLSYWSAIEGIGSKFARYNERTRKGAINKICDCLDQVWGAKDTWKVIPNSSEAINGFQKSRNGIAHGFISIDVDTIKRVSADNLIISSLAYEFLKDWENQGFNPEP